MSGEVLREPGVERCEHGDVCEHACRMGCRAYKPMVDRDALLALAEEMEGDAGCHAYVDDYVVNDYSRRIREALGVES